MVKGALLRQQLHGTVQVGARDRASEDDKESSTNKMATKRRHHLPHRYQYNLNPFPFLFIRIVLWSNVMWSSVYDLGVHSCSLGIQDGKPGCRAPDAAASDDGYSECIAVHPCAPTEPAITIVGSDYPEATDFAGFAFYGYSGTLMVSGRFPAVRHIHIKAFGGKKDGEMNADSELVFDRDSFPMLVEIGPHAFAHFRGKIRFANNPFPALQSIESGAFEGCRFRSSRVELINQLHLKTLKEKAFLNYAGSVVLKGKLPQLESVAFEAFHYADGLRSLQQGDGVTVEQVVMLKDLPLLRHVGPEAFSHFLGELHFEGSFPSLEFIGSDAFRDLRGVTVSFSLPVGAPALQCLGQFAFANTPWQTKLTIKGDFPCLLAVDPTGELDEDGEWIGTPNAGDDIFKQVLGELSTDRIKLRVKSCKPGASGWCAETTTGCNSVNGFAKSEWCESTNQDAFNRLDGINVIDVPMNPPYNNQNDACQQDCRLALVNREVGCRPHDPKQDTVECPSPEVCSSIYTSSSRIVITSRNDVTEISIAAFRNFPGAMIMEGRFLRLVRIGRYAFDNVGRSSSASGEAAPTRAASRLHFGRDAFPVLVEIGFGAFRNFYGSIRFVDSPFRKLQHIGDSAFSFDVAKAKDVGRDVTINRFIDLTNHQSLSVLDHRAFSDFGGKVLLSGDLPNLTYIGGRAFESHFHESETVVQLIDLPKLQVIAAQAFQTMKVPVELRGAFPSLEFIGAHAFGNAGARNNVTVALQGGPSLRCIGNDAFAATSADAAYSGGLSITGSFPCLNLYNGLESATEFDGKKPFDAPFNKPVEFYSKINSSMTAIDFQTHRCVTVRVPIHEYRCKTSQQECTAQRGDDQFAPCRKDTDEMFTDLWIYQKYADHDVDPKKCSLGINNDKAVGCIADGSDAYCAPTSDRRERCSSISASRVEVFGRDDVTEFHDHGFGRYSSKITVTGHFKRLERIGFGAFNSAGTADSSISFGADDLPVLVEIHNGAFQNFKGNVRFVGSPFPNLKMVMEGAFNNVAGAKSRVEIADHQELEQVQRGAFEDFPSVLLRGSFPKLEIIGENAFSTQSISINASCPVSSVVEVTNAPMLRVISDKAFLYFCGSLRMEDTFPSLEVIGENAFSHCSNATVRLAQGAPALRCIGDKAFLRGSFKNAETVFVLTGSFPCLMLDENQPDLLWNNPSEWWSGSTKELREASDGIQIDMEVGGNCTEALSSTECSTLSKNKDMCKSKGGDRRFTPCDSGSSYVDFAPLSTCTYSQGSLGYFDGRMGCIAEGSDVESDCLQSEAGCQSETAELIIGTHGQVSTFAAFGFYKYGGSIRVHGYFKQLQTIDIRAFHRAGTPASSIVFGKGSLPVLVEIGGSAFSEFRGIIRIESGAFPNLQKLGKESFLGLEGMPFSASSENSRVELVDQLHLTKIFQSCFHLFPGTIVVHGKFPKLAGLGKEAFSMHGTNAGNPDSLVELISLERLQLIENGAFRSFPGTVRMEGCFPMLREIHIQAFAGVANMTFTMAHGAPVLSCIGGRPFQPEFGEKAQQITIAGSFPCLNLTEEKQCNPNPWSEDDSTCNDPNDFLSASKEKTISLFKYAGSPIDISAQFGVSDGCTDLLSFDASDGGVPKSLWCMYSASRCNADFANPESGSIECGIDMFTLEMLEEDDPSASSENVSTATTTTAAAPPRNTTYYGGNKNSGADDPAPSSSIGNVVGGAVAAILLSFFAVVVALWCRQTRADNRRTSIVMTDLCNATKERARLKFLATYSRRLMNNVQSAAEYAIVVDGLELPRKSVLFVRKIGAGNYGEVALAELAETGSIDGHGNNNDGAAVQVAVKSRLPGESDPTVDEALMIEALVLHSLKHKYVLGLVGISSTTMPFLIVTEMMQNGDLKTYLRACRPSQPKPKATLTLLDIATIVERIAGALAYLEAVSIVHRDVAARNVLVGAGPTDVKLGDLGAARSVFREESREYTATSDHKPARWMALESLKAATFSNKTDVWGFGVLCWEVTTLAKTPYGALGVKDMVDSLVKGDRLEEAPFTPPGLYKQMKLCWSEDPKRRPRFENLVHSIGSIRGALAVTAEGGATLGWDNTLDTGSAAAAAAATAPAAPAAASGSGDANAADMPVFPVYTGGDYVDALLEFEESPYSACSPLAPAAASHEYQNLVFNRVVTSSYDIIDMDTSPFGSLDAVALLDLTAAVAFTKAHSVCSGGLDKEVASALQFADVVLARGLGMGLSRDQIASIHLYTQDSSLYGGLNGALGGWGPGGRTAVSHYTHYIKVALSGLRLLPKVEMTVYRGVRDVSLKTLLNGQDIHGIIAWWAFTSTTGTSDVLRDPTFFGIGEGHGDRVVFKIKIKTGVRISSFSDMGSNADDYLTPFGVEAPLNEDEIVLLPGTRFKIDAINTYTNNVTEIEMHELVAGEEQLQPAPAPSVAGSGDLGRPGVSQQQQPPFQPTPSSFAGYVELGQPLSGDPNQQSPQQQQHHTSVVAVVPNGINASSAAHAVIELPTATPPDGLGVVLDGTPPLQSDETRL